MPIGVRAAPRITVFGMGSLFSCGGCWVRAREWYRPARGRPRRRAASARRAPAAGRAVRPRPRRRVDMVSAHAGLRELTAGPRERRRHRRGRALRGRGAAARACPRSSASCSPRARRGARFKTLALAHAAGKRWLLVGLGARAELRRRARPRGRRGGARARARALDAGALLGSRRAETGDGGRRRARRGHGARRLPLRACTSPRPPARARRRRSAAKQPRRADRVRARRHRERGRRRRDRGRRGEPRARPAEPPRQRPHADGAGRVRARRWPRTIERAVGRGRGARGHHRRAAWARSPRSRRDPSRSPR